MNTHFIDPITTKPWANGRHWVRCVRTVQETWDIRSFYFTADPSLSFSFKPGQFVTLELEIDGEPVMRSYTISSSPSMPYSFSISVKRVAGGQVSNWLHDHLNEGDELAIHGPVGMFNCIDFPADKVLLLSGGIGVTPLMSMARWWFDTHSATDIVFVHSAKQPRDIVYRSELEHMDARAANFQLATLCEHHDLGESWSGYRGRLSEELLQLIAPDFIEREIFCCGPPAYMDAVKAMLAAHGFPMAHYHEELFVSPTVDGNAEAKDQAVAPVGNAQASPRVERHSVNFVKTGKCAQIEAGETVHQAAAKIGLHIPKGCGMGLCGTCKVHVLSGELTKDHNGGITDADIEAGYILSCSSTPLSDVELDY